MQPSPAAAALLLRVTNHAYPRRKDRQLVRQALSDPFFPRTYLVRNLLALEQEPAWKRCTPRLQRAWLLQVILQRSDFFLQVRQWVQTQDGNAAAGDFAAAERPPANGYCNHCGECCEIASGLPQFPVPDQLPLDWQLIFAAGLGRHHRFCAFLWEIAGSGRSLCAIHRWRPLPCRLFEKDECDYLRQHPPAFGGSNNLSLLQQLHRYLGVAQR